MMVSMFMLFSLVFDIYKKFSMYLASKDGNMSSASYQKNIKISTYVLVATQFSFGIFQADLIIGVLMTAILYQRHNIDTWEELQLISIFSLFLIVFILYIIILRKLILILSIKYPEFYKLERKQIISSVSIILASILMRILELGLYAIDPVKEALKTSYQDRGWLYPITLLLFLSTTTIMQISAVLFQLRKYIYQMTLIQRYKATTSGNRRSSKINSSDEASLMRFQEDSNSTVQRKTGIEQNDDVDVAVALN